MPHDRAGHRPAGHRVAEGLRPDLPADSRAGPNFSTRPAIQYIYENGFTHYRVGYASALSFMFFLVIVAVSAAAVRGPAPAGDGGGEVVTVQAAGPAARTDGVAPRRRSSSRRGRLRPGGVLVGRRARPGGDRLAGAVRLGARHVAEARRGDDRHARQLDASTLDLRRLRQRARERRHLPLVLQLARSSSVVVTALTVLLGSHGGVRVLARARSAAGAALLPHRRRA